VRDLRAFRAGFRKTRPLVQEVPAHTFDAEHALELKGGARVRWLNVTGPFVTMSVDEEWARLRGPIPTVWVNRQSVTAVKRVTGPLGSSILFRSDDGRYDAVAFRTLGARGILESLTKLGWPVDL
jgi:hypothetical protein